MVPQDVKKMLLNQARMVFWKKLAAKHECEELKEGAWLDPIQSMLRRKTHESCTDKHRHVTRNSVVEGGWVQKRCHDTGCSDEKKCRGCNKEEGTGCTHCPSRREEVRNQIPEGLDKWEQRAKTSKEDWKWQRGITSNPLRVNISWSMPAEGFQEPCHH